MGSSARQGLWGAVPLPIIIVLVPLLLLIIPLASFGGNTFLGSRARVLLLERFSRAEPSGGSTAALQQQLQQLGSAFGDALPTAAAGGSGKPGQQSCAIFNGVMYHLDVLAGLTWAFQEAGCKTDVYMHPKSKGVTDVMKGWFRGRMLPREEMEPRLRQYDVVIMITFPEGPDYIAKQNRLLLSRHPHQRIILLLHNPGWLLNATLYKDTMIWQPLLLSQLVPHNSTSPAGESSAAAGNAPPPQPVQLLSLAPCGAAYSRSLFETWSAGIQSLYPKDLPHLEPRLSVPWIAPMVPWAPSDERPSPGGPGRKEGLASSGEGAYAGTVKNLCIQGSVDPRRRDYKAAFAAASHPAVLQRLQRRRENLLLVGSYKGADLEVPEVLKPHVKILNNLQYQAYYDMLSRCRAILTAFGSDMYIINKTSSTMAAALQVGTPIITEERVLAAYEYVPAAATFTYDAPGGTPERDPAALAAIEGEAFVKIVRDRLEARKRAMARGRRLIEDLEEAAEGAKDAGDEARELEGEERGMEASEEEEGQQGGKRQAAVEEEEAEGSQEEEEQQQVQQKQAGVEPPPAGSLAAAMLATFEDKDARAAHTAAWRAKHAVMQRNIETAQQVLADTAAWVAAVQAKQA